MIKVRPKESRGLASAGKGQTDHRGTRQPCEHSLSLSALEATGVKGQRPPAAPEGLISPAPTGVALGKAGRRVFG